MTPSAEVKAALEAVVEIAEETASLIEEGNEYGDAVERNVATLRAYLRTFDQREAVVQAAILIHPEHRLHEDSINNAERRLLDAVAALLEAEAKCQHP